MTHAMSMAHPLAATCARLAGLSSYLKAELGMPNGDEWISPLQHFAPDSPRWAETVGATERIFHTVIPNIVGSVILQRYQWLVIGCAVGSFLLDRRVPDLDVDHVRVHFMHRTKGGATEAVEEIERIAFTRGRFAALPDDPAAAHPDALIVPDEDALRAYLRTSLEAHFMPIIHLIHTGLGSGRRGLWLNVADRSASSFIWLMQAQDEPGGLAQIQQELDHLLGAPDSSLKTNKVSVMELTFQEYSHCYHDRATCCYWYKIDGGDYCSTCPHRPQEERKARLRNYLAEQYAARYPARSAATTTETLAVAAD